MSNGICVVGRGCRMGLGSMTEDFCSEMNPDKTLIMGRVTHGENDLSKFKNVRLVDETRWKNDKGYIAELIWPCKIVVGFETFYRDSLPAILREWEVKTVMFPMWEWSPPSILDADYIINLSDTDQQQYPQGLRYDWPASSAVHEENRVINWPPKTFVHLAGNAQHNRDGTKQVLLAAIALYGTGAKLRVYHSFDLTQWSIPYSDQDVIELRPSVASRRDLFSGMDCLVQPRGLPGHSLPINEAIGEGIPVIPLALPDWVNCPYRVSARRTENQLRCRVPTNLWEANLEELGYRMRSMALGEAWAEPAPRVPTWNEFRAWWDATIL